MRGVNTSLFKTWHAAFAGALVLGLVVFRIQTGSDSGWSLETHRPFLIASGWATLLSFVVVLGYVLRKYMHKLRYSPEFRMRVSMADLERFDEKLNQMRVDVVKGLLTSKSEIEKRAARHLKETGVQRIVKVLVEPGPPEGPAFLLQARPTEPLGRTALWLHAHVFYGLAMGALVFLHGGGSVGSLPGLLMNVCGALVILTGIFGITLWAFGPTWLSRKEREHGLSIEQAYVLHESHSKKLKELLQGFESGSRKALEALQKASTREEFIQKARETTNLLLASRVDKIAEAQELMTLTGQHQRIRAALGDLWKIRFAYMIWRAVHVPCAVFLLGLALVHVATVWRY